MLNSRLAGRISLNTVEWRAWGVGQMSGGSGGGGVEAERGQWETRLPGPASGKTCH